MSTLEMKVDAMARLMLACSKESRAEALGDLQQLMTDASLKHSIHVDKESEIHNLLRELGVPVRLKGYPRLAYGISLVVDNPDFCNAITTALYPRIAEKYNDTTSRVERSIRHAVEVCLTRADLDVFWKYFGNTVSLEKGKPTNGEFIANVAHIIRERIREVASK